MLAIFEGDAIVSIRVVYISTPEFGVPTLQLLAEDKRFDLVGVVTQPDKPAGRGLRRLPSPIKSAAQALELNVLQPASLKTPEALAAIDALRPDLIAVAAYGQWIPESVFNLPSKRSLNLHPSLLPRHRGAAPVVSAILAGDTEVGLSVLFVEDEMDGGDILAQMSIPLGENDTTGSVMVKLAKIGAPFFLDTLADWAQDKIVPVPQDHSQSTWFDRMGKEAGLIDWTMPAVEILRRCRAFSPWPGTYTFFKGQRLLIRRATPLVWSETPQGDNVAGIDGLLALSDVETGTVVALNQGIAVRAGEGALQLDEVQMDGRRSVTAVEFARGQRTFVGSRLGQ